MLFNNDFTPLSQVSRHCPKLDAPRITRSLGLCTSGYHSLWNVSIIYYVLLTLITKNQKLITKIEIMYMKVFTKS